MTKPTHDEIVEALDGALDEIDRLANTINGFAYPQHAYLDGPKMMRESM